MDTKEAVEQDAARLLFVDDDPEIRELTEAYLSQQGFVVHSVDSGDAMDAFLAENTVDLIILDLMLPGEHGLSIARRLKTDGSVPIVIVSAQGDDIDRIVGLEMNFQFMPELAVRWAYPVVLGIMLGIGVGMLAYFRRKGWL